MQVNDPTDPSRLHGLDAEAAIAQLELLYARSVAGLRDAVAEFLRSGETPDIASRDAGIFAYPELRVRWAGDPPQEVPVNSYGRFSKRGTYSTTVTRPGLFRAYLREHLSLLARAYGASFEVGPSRQEIPFPYVLDSEMSLDGADAVALARWFPTTELAEIGDEIADGTYATPGDLPLSHFDGLRTDFSLARLRHYTGTPAEHIQPFILFTNYARYVDEFVRWARREIADPTSRYTRLSCAGGIVLDSGTPDPEGAISGLAWKNHQMPAYHLMAADGPGVTLVNIGVGPSNAKTICDHLAVLRPHAWLMIGHCGGLRASQRIGDYVLAHAYLRDDHVLDAVLPPDIPVPSIAEVQVALQEATRRVARMPEVKERLRTGTVVTTDDRNWELHYSKSALRFNQSRAVAIDMESATIAAQGFRFRVPYGTLLCVSDKPLHGEIKLPGQANRFYEGAISEHLQIGIHAIDLLRKEGDRLHSRKLRSFDEPPFR